jgi:hypothetical protein
MARKLGLLGYVKAAFRQHANLAFVALFSLAGLIWIDNPLLFWLPGAALEMLYLLAMSQNARFQRLCEARESAKEAKKQELRVDSLVASLEPRDRERFRSLQRRCQALLESTAQAEADRDLLGDERISSTNRLLWMCLRALLYRRALDQFLTTTPEAALRARIGQLDTQLEDKKLLDRARQTLAENRKVVEARLANVERAQANRRAVDAELSQIEDLASLALERGLTSAGLGDLNAQVNGVRSGLESMETLVREVVGESPTLLVPEGDVPPILSKPVPTTG